MGPMLTCGPEQYPPPPSSLDELARVQATRLRCRLLYSTFEQDVTERLSRYLAQVRREAWGPPDLTANPYAQMWEQVAVSYDGEVQTIVPAGGEGMREIVDDAGLWPLMQRFERDLHGLREMLMHVSVDASGVVSYRPVRPDMVEVEASPSRRDEPVKLAEWILEDGRWYRHVYDVRVPSYAVYDDRGVDVTARILGALYSGDSYPYRMDDGTPVLPYVLYHARRTGYPWDPYAMGEVAEGSLNVCVLLTFYGHVVRNAAWRQRYMAGLEPLGMGVEGADAAAPPRSEVVSDPATVLLMRAAEGYQGQPIVGTFDAPMDPEALLRSIAMYERRILSAAGLAPADVTRQTADIRSGYSLAVAREAIRALQVRVHPQLRRGDRALLALTAILHNAATGSRLPESGYDVLYAGTAPSPADVAAQRAGLREDLAVGLLSPVDAYMELHPELSREAAVNELLRVAAERKALAAAGIGNQEIPNA